MIPAVGALHRAAHQRGPRLLVVGIELYRHLHHVQHVVRVVVGKGEAVALAGELVVGLHGIAQAAGLAHYRQRAVAQRYHLAQAAGLEHGRHEEHVRAGVYLVRQRVAHLYARGQLARILPLRPVEQVDVLVVALAQHGYLRAGGHQLGQHALDQLQALLAGEAAHHAYQRHTRVYLQSQLLLQRRLVVLLLCRSAQRIVGVYQRIGRGVVLVGVYAVEYAHQLIAARAQQAVQPLAVVAGLYLQRVGRADGGEIVGKLESALHEAGAAVELYVVGRIRPGAQRQQVLDVVYREHALVLEVVNRIQRLYAAVEVQRLVLALEQHGYHAGLPVVAMQHVGLEADMRQRLQHRAVKVRKALALVAAQSVHVGPAEVVFVIHEVEGYAFVNQFLYAAVLPAPAQVYVEIELMSHLVAPRFGYLAVQRQYHAHVHVVFEYLLGQRAYYVGQASGFDKRNAFRCGKQHFHHQYHPLCHLSKACLFTLLL